MSEWKKLSLVQALAARFLPMLEERGFARHPLSNKDQRSPELLGAFPLGSMKRVRDAALDILEVQFDKGGAARFVVNFGTAPPEGVVLPWVRLAQNEVTVSSLPEAYRLYSNTAVARWFSLSLFPRDAAAGANRVVDKVIELYPEIDAWFAAGSMGSHLRRFGFPTSGGRS